ncbi:MAG: PDZ domain-containing protein [Deltaproteobacteria bacterium]|nr:PDZ domain-containing protein [Deltaproteobacteria bacterium]
MNYIELFKKYSWLMDLALLIVLAYILASFTSMVIRYRLFTLPSPGRATGAASRKAMTSQIKKEQGYYMSIVDRDIFDSSAQGIDEITGTTSGPVTRTNLNAKLLGTVAGSSEYAYSVIQLDKNINIYRVKDHLGNAIILSIERKKVILLHNGAKEELSMFEEGNQGVGPATGPGGGNIQEVSQGNYVIPENQFKSATQGWGRPSPVSAVVPNLEAGRINGYRIFAITPGSLYANIGLQNGDIIHSVNGIQVTTPESALELFQQLQNESRFTVNIDRNGQGMTLNYTVQ